MQSQHHDLVIIGGGPGGYVAAIRAAQLGLNVACIEQELRLGGTCLRVGCIPSKVLLESSERYWETHHHLASHGIRAKDVTLDLPALLQRKDTVVQTLTKGIDGLFKKNRVTRYEGHGRLNGPGQVTVATRDATLQIQAPHIILATGSRSASLPGVPIDGDRIGTSTEALAFREVPKRLVVIGAGYIGLELGLVWHRLGSQVIMLEFLDRILPGMDDEIAVEAHRIFTRQGIDFRLSCRVTGARSCPGHALVDIEGASAIEADQVLVAVGRVPNTDDLGLDTAGIQLDPRGRIPVHEGFATQVKGIYAIGDVIGGAMLAHKAEEEGIACVERIVTGHGHVDYGAIPGVVFTQPEIASVGKTEQQLLTEKTPFRKGVFPFLASGRARTLGSTDGKVKVLAHAETDRVLGIHIIGPHAGDLIAEASTAMAFGASSEDIARACHAHPTLSEALREACLATHQRAIHI